ARVAEVVRIGDGVADPARRGVADDEDRCAARPRRPAQEADLGPQDIEPGAELITLGLVLAEAGPREWHDRDPVDVHESAARRRDGYGLRAGPRATAVVVPAHVGDRCVEGIAEKAQVIRLQIATPDHGVDVSEL